MIFFGIAPPMLMEAVPASFILPFGECELCWGTLYRAEELPCAREPVFLLNFSKCPVLPSLYKSRRIQCPQAFLASESVLHVFPNSAISRTLRRIRDSQQKLPCFSQYGLGFSGEKLLMVHVLCVVFHSFILSVHKELALLTNCALLRRCTGCFPAYSV